MTTQTGTSVGKRVSRFLLWGTREFFIAFGVLIVVLVLWQLVASANKNIFFPPPLDIFKEFGGLFFSADPAHAFLGPSMFSDVGPSLGRMFVGFVIGVLAGVAIGTLIGLVRATGDYVDPIIEFLRSVPATAALPIFIILLGGQDGMRIAFIAFGSTWFVLINTASGVAAVEPGYREMARAFRISRARSVTRIILPAAMPKIFAGLRISLTAALLLTVISEFFLATNGIGYQLILAQEGFQFRDVWAWMVLLAILGYLFNTVLAVIERYALAWHSKANAYQ